MVPVPGKSQNPFQDLPGTDKMELLDTYTHLALRALTLIPLLMTAACTPKPVARVGHYTITQKDIDYRDQVVHLMYPQEKSKPGKKQLIDAFTAAMILEKYGKPITPEIIKADADRIDRSTRAPELLVKYKAIFGSDQEGYLKNYVLPSYADRTLYYDLFLNDPRIQKDSYESAHRHLEELKAGKGPFKPKTVFRISEARGLRMELINDPRAQKSAPQITDLSAPHLPWKKQWEKELSENQKLEAKKWLEEIAMPLKKGEYFSKVIDRGENWCIVRSLGVSAKGREYVLEAEFSPKLDYSEWLAGERKQVLIEIK
jgi:hypothetical protein